MSNYLLIDIGAGTMDVLWYEEESGLHYKAVVKSPVPCMAEKLNATPGDLLITGVEMGGGALSQILADRTRTGRVVMSVSAAFTLHHDLAKVRSRGIEVVDDSEAEELRKSGKFHLLVTGDLDIERIEGIVRGFGIPFQFDVTAICAQDHGTPPEGVSHLDYRHNIFKTRLDQTPFPHALLFKDDETPSTFNRLRCIAERAAEALPTREVYVMDSGMAAILGASQDLQAMRKERLLVLDIATSHTVGAALNQGELAGFFEYHTHDITLKRLEGLLADLADGKLDHARILDEGGHGAYIRRAFGFELVQAIVATGPKRRLLRGTNLPIAYGSPLGDNMMTGTVGLLEAVRRRKGLLPVQYL